MLLIKDNGREFLVTDFIGFVFKVREIGFPIL